VLYREEVLRMTRGSQGSDDDPAAVEPAAGELCATHIAAHGGVAGGGGEAPAPCLGNGGRRTAWRCGHWIA
jgi:hypothetical protein